jgi:molybdopterin-guanine dinucleotide biosynthesis protein A
MSRISGVILCGGEARRMQGVDKPLQLLNGIPLVAHVRNRLAPQVGEIIISANRNHDRYRSIVGSDAIVSDAEPNLGPLGGMVSALEKVTTPLTFCCPGDAPYLHEHLVSRLNAALHTNPTSNAAIPHDGDRTQHLFVLLRTNMKEMLTEYLERGNRSVHSFVEACQPAVVECADIKESFRNLNTNEELHSANAVSPRR